MNNFKDSKNFVRGTSIRDSNDLAEVHRYNVWLSARARFPHISAEDLVGYKAANVSDAKLEKLNNAIGLAKARGELDGVNMNYSFLDSDEECLIPGRKEIAALREVIVQEEIGY